MYYVSQPVYTLKSVAGLLINMTDIFGSNVFLRVRVRWQAPAWLGITINGREIDAFAPVVAAFGRRSCRL